MRNLRRGLSRACGPDGPPVACLALMLLLCCLSTLGGCEQLSLESDQIFRHFQVHRVFTYAVCPRDPTILILDLLLFVLLGWHQERELGTLRYLQRASLCTTVSAVFFLILAPLLAPSQRGACGYTAVHLALLAANLFAQLNGVLMRVKSLVLPLGVLLSAYLLLPGLPFLLHMCGVLTGLLYSAGILSWLDMTTKKLEQLESRAFFQALAKNPIVHFVSTPMTEGRLPVTHPIARDRSPGLQEPRWANQNLPAGYPENSSGIYEGEGESFGQNPGDLWDQQPFFRDEGHPQTYNFPPWLPPGWQQDVPLAVVDTSLVEEEMLQAGIHASLQQAGLEASPDLMLPKSSVSALRLQQLQKMGFSTQQAVVALAATGKVEGAVSLLVEGQVGEDAVVTIESGLPQSPHGAQRASMQGHHHLSGD